MLQNINDIDISDITCHICRNKLIKEPSGTKVYQEAISIYCKEDHIHIRSDNINFYRWKIVSLKRNIYLSRFQLFEQNLTTLNHRNLYCYFPFYITNNYYDNFLSIKLKIDEKFELVNLLN